MISKAFFFAIALAALPCAVALAAPATRPSSEAILQDLKSFGQVGSVLYVAAHPDDENTQLITYLARGRGYRTGYLSLTRGDGGQNLLGPEFGDELGVIRTQELLSARRLDGGIQFFSRARDFGYSKDVKQTLKKWDQDEVIADIVRVIRDFQPDVMITRFSTVPSQTHGHHTASAILALDAYKVADDPKQPVDLPAWKPKRIFMNGQSGFRQANQLVPGAKAGIDAVRVDIGGIDPVLGIPFGTIASRSRAMHKTQGFGNFGGGGRGGGGPQYETFQLLDGEPATKDIMDGVDTTWGRYAGGEKIAVLVDAAIAGFNVDDPSASVPALLQIRGLVNQLPDSPVIGDKKRQLDRILQDCLGLDLEVATPNAEVVPGERMPLTLTAVVHSGVAVKWVGMNYPGESGGAFETVDLKTDQPAVKDVTKTLAADTPISQKYWLREDPTAGMFRVDDASLIGRPENPPAYPVSWVMEVGGQRIVIPDEPVQVEANRRRLDVIPPVALRLPEEVALFAPGQTKSVKVEVTAYRAGAAGTVQLNPPTASTGWSVAAAGQGFSLATVGEHATFEFTVTAPTSVQSGELTAWAVVGGATYDTGRVEISYPHIPVQLLQPAARVKAVCLDLAVTAKSIGYLPGAGDSVADSLRQMGCSVTELKGEDLTAENLKKFDAVVIGVRAFNVRDDLAATMPGLLAYVKAGGTVVAQYNTPNGVKTPELGPYPLELSRDLPHNRVTDEQSPVTFLAPDHPALNKPNKITAADFDGWVQERGLNFPSSWDEQHYTAILACSDPGEAPLKSGLLIAHYGKGYYVYTGLSWFRQLPAGVPGAFRLFANLISLSQ